MKGKRISVGRAVFELVMLLAFMGAIALVAANVASRRGIQTPNITAWAMLIVAAMALYRGRISTLFARPLLQVKAATDEQGNFRTFIVSNENGTGPAFQVQVVALRLERCPDGSAVPDIILPANLRWAQQTSHERAMPMLPHGLLVALPCSGNGVWDPWPPGRRSGGPLLSARKLAAKRNGVRCLAPGDYVLTVRVVARNHKAVDKRFRLTYTNEEFTTEREAFAKGCRLELLDG